MPYFEVIPIGEVINAVKILRRTTEVKLRNNEKNESVYECQCTLCGKIIYRPVRMIITGALKPDAECIAKYKIYDFVSGVNREVEIVQEEDLD